MTDADESRVERFRWVGSDEPFLDQPALAECGSIVVGRYGGRTEAGAYKNEDGALVWCDAAGAWEFAALLDAHYSAESAELILATLEAERPRLLAALALPVATAFRALQETLLAIFTDAAFRAQCREVYGEASCLIVARKGAAISGGSRSATAWRISCIPRRRGWASICSISASSSSGLASATPSTSQCRATTTGTQRLYPGEALIALATDGVFESIPVFYEQPEQLLYLLAREEQLYDGVGRILDAVHDIHGRDSATLVAWRVRSG